MVECCPYVYELKNSLHFPATDRPTCIVLKQKATMVIILWWIVKEVKSYSRRRALTINVSMYNYNKYVPRSIQSNTQQACGLFVYSKERNIIIFTDSHGWTSQGRGGTGWIWGHVKVGYLDLELWRPAPDLKENRN